MALSADTPQNFYAWAPASGQEDLAFQAEGLSNAMSELEFRAEFLAYLNESSPSTPSVIKAEAENCEGAKQICKNAFKVAKTTLDVVSALPVLGEMLGYIMEAIDNAFQVVDDAIESANVASYHAVNLAFAAAKSVLNAISFGPFKAVFAPHHQCPQHSPNCRERIGQMCDGRDQKTALPTGSVLRLGQWVCCCGGWGVPPGAVGASQNYRPASWEPSNACELTSMFASLVSVLKQSAGLLSLYLATANDCQEEGRYAREVAKLMVVAIMALPDYASMIHNIEMVSCHPLWVIDVVREVNKALVVATVKPTIHACRAQSSVNYLVKRLKCVTTNDEAVTYDPHPNRAEDLKRLEVASAAGTLTFLDILDMLSAASTGDALSILDFSFWVNFLDGYAHYAHMDENLPSAFESSLRELRGVRSFIHELRDAADIQSALYM
ncbi:hypothetical protein BGX34_001563 [Mortierella sp. NVP85]|nr:hypothetical protein BGX34_001563 [Mortierella sp. NVP85]